MWVTSNHMLKYFDVKLSETLLYPFCVPVKVTRLHRLNLHLKAIPLHGWNHRPITSASLKQKDENN